MIKTMVTQFLPLIMPWLGSKGMICCRDSRCDRIITCTESLCHCSENLFLFVVKSLSHTLYLKSNDVVPAGRECGCAN